MIPVRGVRVEDGSVAFLRAACPLAFSEQMCGIPAPVQRYLYVHEAHRTSFWSFSRWCAILAAQRSEGPVEPDQSM